MNNCFITNNTVEWNNMQICKKKSISDLSINNCDFENDNSIPECIYKGPNTAVHLCKIKIVDILKAVQHRLNNTVEIKDESFIMKTCVILLFLPHNTSIKTLDQLDSKLQSLRQIEKNDKRINKWKKDNNYLQQKLIPNSIPHLERLYINGYISKHGKYNLPLSFREIEIFSNPLILKELEEFSDDDELASLNQSFNSIKAVNKNISNLICL